MSDDTTEPPSPERPEDGTTEPSTPESTASAVERLDLDAIERDLDGVQAALARLADGTYWTDEVTGEAIPDDVLAAAPLARRT